MSKLLPSVKRKRFPRRNIVHWSVRYAYGQIASLTSDPERDSNTGSMIDKNSPAKKATMKKPTLS
jgi:hypothetical protein